MSHLRRFALTLAEVDHPDLADIKAVATAIAYAAAGAERPKRSIAGICREQLTRRGVPRHVVEEIREEALAIYQVEIAPRRVTSEFLTVAEVADRLNRSSADVLARLRQWEFRRDMGWPRYLLGEWRFPAAALDARAACFFATLPRVEPFTPPRGFALQPEHPEFARTAS